MTEKRAYAVVREFNSPGHSIGERLAAAGFKPGDQVEIRPREAPSGQCSSCASGEHVCSSDFCECECPASWASEKPAEIRLRVAPGDEWKSLQGYTLAELLSVAAAEDLSSTLANDLVLAAEHFGTLAAAPEGHEAPRGGATHRCRRERCSAYWKISGGAHLFLGARQKCQAQIGCDLEPLVATAATAYVPGQPVRPEHVSHDHTGRYCSLCAPAAGQEVPSALPRELVCDVDGWPKAGESERLRVERESGTEANTDWQHQFCWVNLGYEHNKNPRPSLPEEVVCEHLDRPHKKDSHFDDGPYVCVRPRPAHPPAAKTVEEKQLSEKGGRAITGSTIGPDPRTPDTRTTLQPCTHGRADYRACPHCMGFSKGPAGMPPSATFTFTHAEPVSAAPVDPARVEPEKLGERLVVCGSPLGNVPHKRTVHCHKPRAAPSAGPSTLATKGDL